jgi:hypothetical protein
MGADSRYLLDLRNPFSEELVQQQLNEPHPVNAKPQVGCHLPDSCSNTLTQGNVHY